MSSNLPNLPSDGWSDRGRVMEEIGKARKCSNCSSSDSGLLFCSRCKQTYYCSRDCQVKDWRRHKKQCKEIVEAKRETKEKVGVHTANIRNAWYKQVQTLIPLILVQCFSEHDFDQQPPQKELKIALYFNYNYGIYMPLALPRLGACDFDGRPKIKREYERQHANRQSNRDRTHFMFLIFEDDEMCLACNIDKEIIAAQCQRLGLDVTEYSHNGICKLLSAFSVSQYDPLHMSNKLIFEANLGKQLDFSQRHQVGGDSPWERFVFNAYRMNERNNLRGTHVLICYFLFDFALGKMKRFTQYKLVTMEHAKTLLPEVVQSRYLCLDLPKYLPTLLVEEWGGDLYSAAARAENLPPGFQFWPMEQSLRAAEFFFEELTKIQFPAAGLLPSPSLG